MVSQYTLLPILEHNRDCLFCEDIPGIERITLTELQVRHRTRPILTETYRCSDIFASLAQLQRPVAPRAEMLRACFAVTFRDARPPCRILIEPPEVTVLDGEPGSDIINRWLARRGFVSHGAGTRHAVSDTALGAH